MLTNYVTSLVRTWVPIGVGLVLTWLAEHFHVIISSSTSDALVAVATAALSAGYYAVVRAVEHKVPSLGWLLGVPVRPDYATLRADAIDAGKAVLDDTLGNFGGPDPLDVEGRDPNTPGASAPAEPGVVVADPTAD